VIFTTYWFALFAAAFFPLYWISRGPHWRLIVLLAACALFHAHFAGAAGVLPIVFLALITYGAALWRRTWGLRVALALPVLALLFYKYSHFFALGLVGGFNPQWGIRADHLAQRWLPAAPPLAISFFAFEFVHYLYDVSHGTEPIRNPAKFGAFAIFFPSLVAGPIKRYESFSESLRAGLNRVTVDQAGAGALRIGMGMFKKVVLADNLTAALEYWHHSYAELTRLGRWEFLAGLGLRILLDFSGYSDIAIGLAQMMGIAIPENFSWPYLATNLREFWRRWHISLSSWIRDYVYIPLGGNRHGLGRKVLNGLIAFSLVGLWHGPAWNFVVWGLYNGVGLAISSNYAAVLGAPGALVAAGLARAPVVGWVVTTLFVFVGWLVFFYPVPEATRMFLLLFVSQR